MRSIYRVLIIAVLFFPSFLAATRANAQLLPYFTADLSGSEAVPSNMSGGGAHLSTECPSAMPCGDGDSLRVYLYYWDLEGIATGARIEKAGGGARDSQLVQTLWPGYFQSPCWVGWYLSGSMCEELQHGDMAVVLTSTKYPEGELRGQIRLDYQDSQRAATTWGKIKALY